MDTTQTSTARETAVLAILEKYCIPKEGRADAANHLKWLSGVFAQNPDLYADDWDGQQSVRTMLIRSCDPKPQYDGVTAWAIAGRIVEAMK